MTENGFEIVDSDLWYNYAYETGMISRVLGAMNNPYKANSALRNLLLGGNSWKPDSDNKPDPTDTGETFKGNKPPVLRIPGNKTDEQLEAEEITKIRAVLTLITELFPRMQLGTSERQVMDVLNAIKGNDDHRAWFQKRLGIPVEVVFMCIDQGVIKEENLEASAG